MDRVEFLREEIRSVRTALAESLRRDYGPGRGAKFFRELSARLNSVEDPGDAPPGDPATTADRLQVLYAVSRRVALIERSYLGEFSWPFAEAVRSFAERLFTNEEASGRSEPIIHVVAEGVGYQILDDEAESPFHDRIMIIAFPRQLRHHVLLHAIFGHELAHPSTRSDGTSDVVFRRVLPMLERGPLGGDRAMRRWLERPGCPDAVRSDRTSFDDGQLNDWRIEIFCDLFGLLLFGPAFACAHRAILEPLSPPSSEGDFTNLTHPPYVVRRRLLCDAMRVLGWSEPVQSSDDDGPWRPSEQRMLAYASGDAPPPWTAVMGDDELTNVLSTVAETFAACPDIPFRRPSAENLRELLERLARSRPPIVQRIDDTGAPQNCSVPIQHCLYAGWASWFGRAELRAAYVPEDEPDPRPLPDFLEINQLCEQALWQQMAIDLCLVGGRPA